MKISRHFLLLPLGFCGVSILISCNEYSEAGAGGGGPQQDLAAQVEANAAQMAEMTARSQALQAELAEMKLKAQEDQNLALQEKLEQIQQENDRLLAEAEAARLSGEGLNRSLRDGPAVPGYSYPNTPGYSNTGYSGTPGYTGSDYVSGTGNRYGYGPPASEPGGYSWQEEDADYSVFYEDLSPHGQWIELEGYGYGYRPHLGQQSSWRPYQDGRWVWSDHGWAWDSPEPFGWACYHYGRWVQLSRFGWVWIPGREWAPAWVSWRSSGDYLGWAPLPPSYRRDSWVGDDCDRNYGLAPSSYVFIETRDFHRSSYYGSCLSSTSVNRVFSLTINITNISRSDHHHSHVYFNRGGPDRHWIEQHLGRQSPVASLQFLDRFDRRGLDRNSHNGVPSFFAAPIPEKDGSSRIRPDKVAQKISDIDIVDGWSGVSKDQKDDFQELIVRQAEIAQPGVNESGETVPWVESFREAALERKRQLGDKEKESKKGSEGLPEIGQAGIEQKVEDLRRQQADAMKAQQDLLKQHQKLQEEAEKTALKEGKDSKLAPANQASKEFQDAEKARMAAAAGQVKPDANQTLELRQAEEMAKKLKFQQEESESLQRKMSEAAAKQAEAAQKQAYEMQKQQAQEAATAQQKAQQDLMEQQRQKEAAMKQQQDAAQRDAMAQQERKKMEDAIKQQQQEMAMKQQREAAQREAMAQQERKKAEEAMKYQQQQQQQNMKQQQQAMEQQKKYAEEQQKRAAEAFKQQQNQDNSGKKNDGEKSKNR